MNTSMNPSSSKPIRYVLVFDFETNDLPKYNWAAFEPWPTYKKSKNGEPIYVYKTEVTDEVTNTKVLKKETVVLPASNPADWPYAVQLSYILYDLKTHRKKVVNQKIRLPEGVPMSPVSQQIHKMSLEENQSSHYPYMEDVLLAAKPDFDKADIWIAHNIHFDRNVFLAELTRHAGHNSTLASFLESFYHNKKEYCTMRNGISVCKIEAINCNGVKYMKMPKLADLHTHLFGNAPDPDKLHDALYDVLVCLRCFYKMVFDMDLLNTNPAFFECKAKPIQIKKEPEEPQRFSQRLSLKNRHALQSHA